MNTTINNHRSCLTAGVACAATLFAAAAPAGEFHAGSGEMLVEAALTWLERPRLGS